MKVRINTILLDMKMERVLSFTNTFEGIRKYLLSQWFPNMVFGNTSKGIMKYLQWRKYHLGYFEALEKRVSCIEYPIQSGIPKKVFLITYYGIFKWNTVPREVPYTEIPPLKQIPFKVLWYIGEARLSNRILHTFKDIQ